MHAAGDEALTVAGDFGLQPLQGSGTLKLDRVKLPALWPYVEPFLALDAADGQLDVATAFTYSAADKEPNLALKDLETTLRSLTLRQRWDKQELLRVPALTARGGSVRSAQSNGDGRRACIERRAHRRAARQRRRVEPAKTADRSDADAPPRRRRRRPPNRGA